MKYQISNTSVSWKNAWETAPIAGLCFLVGCQTYAIINPLFRSICLFIGVLLVALYIIMYHRLLLRQDRLLIGLGLFISIGELFNLINASDPLGFRSGAFRLICYILVIGGMIMALRLRSPVVELQSLKFRLPMLLAWVFVAGAVFIYWQSAAQVFAFSAGGRVSGEDLHPVGIAFGFGTCLAVAAGWLIYDRSFTFRIINFIMVLILARGLLLTGSRGALISLICVFLVIGVSRFRHLKSSHRVGLLLLLLFAVVGTFYWLNLSELGRTQLALYRGRLNITGTNQDLAAQERIITWKLYASQFSSWAIFGYRGYSGEYPHNFFYEFWLRFGLLGLASSILAALIVIKSALLVWSQRIAPHACVVIGILVFGFMNAQFNLSLDFNRSFWLGIGFGATLFFDGKLIRYQNGGRQRAHRLVVLSPQKSIKKHTTTA